MKKQKRSIFERLQRILTEQIFWICALFGAGTCGVVLFALRRYENRFLASFDISLILSLIFTAFLILALTVATLKRRREDRRRSRLSAEWIMRGSRLEDIQYKALLNAVTDTVFELDEEENIVYTNRNFLKLTGIPGEDVFGKKFFSFLPRGQREANIKRFHQFIRKELRPYRVKTTIETAEGTYRMVEIAFRILSEADEENSAHVIGTISDREDEKMAEAAVEVAQRKYRDIFQNSISGIYQTTPDGKFLSVNPALADILGYDDVNDVLNSVHSIASQIYVRPEDRAIFKNMMERDGTVKGFEAQMYRKEGTKIWVVENARAVKNSEGRILYYEGSLWDITERRKTEEELKDAKLIAEMTSRTKTEFLANMSHELRTPLNAIIGFSEIIKDEIMGELAIPAYKEYASDIYSSGNDLLRIISEILEVSKIEAGNRELNEGPVKISRAVGSCLIILKGKIENHQLTVNLELDDGLPEMVGEELVIKQMMLNLISNAVKFTPEHGEIIIKGYVSEKTGNLVIEVVDNGIGMSREEVDKAVQPFWQANSSLARDTSGTGLGLTLVKSLAGLHDAKLELESEKGKGTIARLIFPESRILRSAASPANKQ